VAPPRTRAHPESATDDVGTGASGLLHPGLQTAAGAPNICLTSASFVSTDVGTGCAASQFLLGLLADSSWSAWDAPSASAQRGPRVYAEYSPLERASTVAVATT